MKRISSLIVLLVILSMPAGVVAAAERMAVKSNIANIRSEPNTKSDTLWQVEKYHPLLVVDKTGAWYAIKDLDGHQGWIHRSLLDKTPTVVVRVRLCNVRTGPGTQYDIAFPANKGVPFKVLEKKGRWTKVQHADGDGGWIFNSLIW